MTVNFKNNLSAEIMQKLHRAVLFSALLGLLFAAACPFLSFAASEKQPLAAPVLKPVSGFTISWEKSEETRAYEVRLSIDPGTGGEPELIVFTVNGTSANLSDYAAAGKISCRVRALPSSEDRTHRESAWTELSDPLYPAEDNTAEGYFFRSNGRITFTCLSGKAAQGWQKLNGFWYYFDPDNHNEAVKGWKTVGTDRYFFDQYGHMLCGWQEIDGVKYYFSETEGGDQGKLQTGLQELSPNVFYYFRTEQDAAAASLPAGSLDEEKTGAVNPGVQIPYTLPISTETAASAALTDNPPAKTGNGGTGTASGWLTNPDGSWSYLSENGELLKNCWHEEAGFRYYFNSQAVMLTGRQYVDGEWRYFALENDPSGLPEGACAENRENTIESEGVSENAGNTKNAENTVNTVNTGSAAAAGHSGSAPCIIRQCSLTVRVKEAAPGAVYPVELAGAGSSEIVSAEFSVPYEDQKPGMTVRITAVLRAKDGFGFSSSCVYSCRSARIISNTGTEAERTLCLEYTAQTKLSAPEVFYSNREFILQWMRPSHAARFRITISNGYERRVTFCTEQPLIDLSDYGDPTDEEQIMSIEIASLEPENSSGYVGSEKTVISNAFAFTAEHTVHGDFEITESGMRFINDSGEALTGWQEILGNRYLFDALGYAVNPGWYEDTDGNRYFFDDCHRLQKE